MAADLPVMGMDSYYTSVQVDRTSNNCRSVGLLHLDRNVLHSARVLGIVLGWFPVVRRVVGALVPLAKDSAGTPVTE